MAKNQRKSHSRTASFTIPELEQAKTAVLKTLVSVHSRRSYKYALEKFIAWYCSEPRLGFNRAVVVRYRSFLESLSLSAATINLHLSTIRRLADESAESGWLSPELATGIRRVKGVKQLGRRIGNWLTGDQSQTLLNAISKSTLQDRRDAAMVGLLGWMRPEASRSYKFATRAVSVEGRSLGDRRSDRQRRAAPRGTGARVVQESDRQLATGFGSERWKSVQTSFEKWSATRCWSDA